MDSIWAAYARFSAVLSSRLAMGLFCGVLGACSPADDGPCADTRTVIAVPTPLWQQGPLLVAPPGDRAAAAISRVRRRWSSQLAQIDGWPMRPTILIPLSAPATGVDASLVKLYGADAAGELRAYEMVFEELILEQETLQLRPQQPMPPSAVSVIVVLEPGAVQGAVPLPACGDAGPHPDYRAAKAALPEAQAVSLALPIRLSRIPEQLQAHVQELRRSSVLEVQNLEIVAFDHFGDASPTATVAAHLSPSVALGRLNLPDYRAANGVFSRGEGLFEVQGVTSPGVLVVTPAAGAAPFPFVLFQHGGGQDKTEVFKVAGPLAEAGFALVAIDLPYHGDRAAAGGGDDFDMLDFDSPLRTRDNFRQAVSDHLAVLNGVPALNEGLRAVLGVPQVLDPGRAFYMGLSMGAVSGSLTYSVEPKLKGAGLFVGGGDFATLLSSGFFSFFVTEVLEEPPVLRAAILGFMETLLNGMDPIAYAQRTEDRTAAPRPALFMQAVADPLIGAESSDVWARAFGADVVSPRDHEVAGMQTLTLPAQDNFQWASGSATRLLYQCPMNEVPASGRHGRLVRQDYAQQIIAHCFRTTLDSGSCEARGFDFELH